MATISTPGTTLPQRGGGDVNNNGAAINLDGAFHHQLYVSDIDDADTITPGMGSIVRAAFEPDDASDDVNVVVTDVSTLTFNAGAGSGHSGTVHIWSRGY